LELSNGPGHDVYAKQSRGATCGSRSAQRFPLLVQPTDS
jgi:hypothetical protein